MRHSFPEAKNDVIDKDIAKLYELLNALKNVAKAQKVEEVERHQINRLASGVVRDLQSLIQDAYDFSYELPKPSEKQKSYLAGSLGQWLGWASSENTELQSMLIDGFEKKSPEEIRDAAKRAVQIIKHGFLGTIMPDNIYDSMKDLEKQVEYLDRAIKSRQ